MDIFDLPQGFVKSYRAPRSLAELMRSVLLHDPEARDRVLGAYMAKVWREHAPQYIVAHTGEVTYAKGRCTIRITNGALRTNLCMEQARMLDYLNDVLGGQYVRVLIFA